VKNTGCGDHHYAIFSMIRLPPFKVQISSLTLCSQNLVMNPRGFQSQDGLSVAK